MREGIHLQAKNENPLQQNKQGLSAESALLLSDGVFEGWTLVRRNGN